MADREYTLEELQAMAEPSPAPQEYSLEDLQGMQQPQVLPQPVAGPSPEGASYTQQGPSYLPMLGQGLVNGISSIVDPFAKIGGHILEQNSQGSSVPVLDGVAQYAMDDVAKPLIEAYKTGQFNPYEAGGRVAAETITGMGMDTLSAALPGLPGVGIKLLRSPVQAITGEAVHQIANYFYDNTDDAPDQSSIKNIITNSMALWMQHGAGALVSKASNAISDIPDDLTTLQDNAQKRLAGDKPVYERRADKKGMTLRNETGDEVKPGTAPRELLQYTNEIDKGRAVLDEKGYFDNYSNPQNFVARLRDGEGEALDKRAEILKSAEDSVINKLENPTPRGKTPNIPPIEPQLAVLQKQIDELVVTSPNSRLLKFYQGVKSDIQNRIEQKLTPEGLQAVARQTEQSPDELIAKYFSKPETVRTETVRPSNLKKGSKTSLIGVDSEPSKHYSDDWLKGSVDVHNVHPVYATDLPPDQPFDVKASRVPEYETPQVMSLSKLYDLRTELQNKANNYFLKTKGKGADYAKAKAYAQGATAVGDTIETYQTALKEGGFLSGGDLKQLKDIDKELSAIITFKPMALGVSAQTKPGAGAPVERLQARGMMQRGLDYFGRNKDRAINNYTPNLDTGSSNMFGATGDALGAAGQAMQSPLFGPATNELNNTSQPLLFPRDTQRFFSLPTDLIAQELGPEVASNIDQLRSASPTVQRSYLSQISSENKDKFQSPPSGLSGFNPIDGVIDDPAEIQALNQQLRDVVKKPGADISMVAKLRSALNGRQPLTVRPSSVSTAESEHIARQVSVGGGQTRQEYDY